MDCHMKAMNYIHGEPIVKWEICTIDNMTRLATIHKSSSGYILDDGGMIYEIENPVTGYKEFKERLSRRVVH